MSRIIYALSVSLDGYAEDRHGGIAWTAPDPELLAFFNNQARDQAAFIYGRRTYENMASGWPEVAADPGASPTMADFARIWTSKPKVVFSRTLASVAHESRLDRGDVADAIPRLKAEFDGDMSVCGPTLASSLVARGLVDEYRLFVRPVVLGGGKPFFPSLVYPLNLRLLETRTFGGGVTYTRYEAAR